jgi:hypothetical protein
MKVYGKGCPADIISFLPPPTKREIGQRGDYLSLSESTKKGKLLGFALIPSPENS